MTISSFKAAIILCLCAFGSRLDAQSDPSRLSLNLMQWLHEHPARSENNGQAKTGAETYLGALIKVNAHVDETALRNLGCTVGTKAGDIWTVRVPRQQMRAFTQITGIDYIEMDRPVARQIDSARYFIRVDSVHWGTGLPMPLTGKGVIIGIDDDGYDYTHPAFYDTTGTKLRIRRAWHQMLDGTPPEGYSYGAEFPDTASILERKFDMDDFGSHGTMVASIAAGSGLGSTNNSRYRGIAYESDLVLVTCPTTYEDWRSMNMTTIIDAFNYIFTYAQSEGKPAVINASLGSQLGPRDGSSLFSQACDNLTGPGRILVFSAGNEGAQSNHLQKSFSATDTVISTLVPNLKVDGGLNKNYIEIWGDSLQSFCLQFGMYKNGTLQSDTTVYCLDNSSKSFFLIGSDNDTCYITLTTKLQEYNNKPHASVDLFSRSNDTLCLRVLASSGDVHLWQEYFDESWNTYYGKFVGNGTWATAGDGEYTIGEMGCTKSAITVGSYVSRITWRNLQNQVYYNRSNTAQGSLSTFSSIGPSLDNRMKPDISAPGSMIAVATSSYDQSLVPGGSSAITLVAKHTSPRNGRDYYYAVGQGTSFSSPLVCGVVALMLQVNPNLSPDMVKDILYSTAIRDNFTTPSPDPSRWGAGKLNAYAAIKETILQAGAVAIPTYEPAISVYPNPGRERFTVEYEAPASGYFLVTVSNAVGQLVKHQAWELSAGKNQLSVELNEHSGLYFITITGRGGSVVKKIVIQ